jgi:hypothetical protein
MTHQQQTILPISMISLPLRRVYAGILVSAHGCICDRYTNVYEENVYDTNVYET